MSGFRTNRCCPNEFRTDFGQIKLQNGLAQVAGLERIVHLSFVMRTIRYTPPNTDWFVTSRCLQAQHLMRPDAEMTGRFGYWLARSLSVYPGIKLRAAVQMSNHYHLVLRDTLGQLSDFMRYFGGNLAKSINGLRDRTGAVFHDRYSASPILDDAGVDGRRRTRRQKNENQEA